MKNHKDILTTGDISRICKVATRTAAKWMDGGQIPHWRVGKTDRRCKRSDLIKFMYKTGIPVEFTEIDDSNRILIVGEREVISDDVMKLESDDFLIRSSNSPFESGMISAEFKPTCIIIDLSIGTIETRQIVEYSRKINPSITTVGIFIYEDSIRGLKFDILCKIPYKPADLAAQIRSFRV